MSVFWSVYVGGSPLDAQRTQAIQSISVNENCDGSDTCTILISDPEFLFIEDNIFVEDVPIAVAMGIVGDTSPTNFSGYISAIDIDFPEEGTPVLSLYCLDNTHLMNRTKKSRSWDNVSRANVAEKIAKEYGLSFNLQSGYAGKVETTISQSNQTDIEFLESLAKAEEPDIYLCKVMGSTLSYLKKGILNNPVSTLAYKKYPWDIISFRPRINKETVPEKSTVSDISTDTKQTDSASASPKDTITQGDAVDNVSSPISKQLFYNVQTEKWEQR